VKAHAADFQVDRVGEGVGREDDGRSALVTDVQFRADADASALLGVEPQPELFRPAGVVGIGEALVELHLRAEVCLRPNGDAGIHEGGRPTGVIRVAVGEDDGDGFAADLLFDLAPDLGGRRRVGGGVYDDVAAFFNSI